MLDNIPNQIGWNKFCILLYTIVLLVHVITIVECVDDDNDETSIVDPESNFELPPIHLIRVSLLFLLLNCVYTIQIIFGNQFHQI